VPLSRLGVTIPPDGRRAEVLELGAVVAYDIPELGAFLKVKGLTTVIAANTVRSHELTVVTEPRASPRRRVLKTAQIVLSEKAPKIECIARNISETGAYLQVSTTFGIPTNFVVIIDGVRRPCRSVWRTDTKLGVAFQ
jgi:hypothetical protein